MTGSPRAEACVGEPISWLRLERHRLGELPPAERDAVAAHLAACAACAACLTEAERPLPLPPLRPIATRASLATRLGRLLFGGSPLGALGRVAAVGVAAAVALALPAREPGPRERASVSLPGVKGGDVSVQLVRERQGAIEHDATSFAPGDRWKVLVTCPHDHVLFWDLVVVDGDGPDTKTPHFPLSPPAPPQTPLACGNHVALPGAFRLSSGRTVDVCLLLSEAPIDRQHMPRLGTCLELHPDQRPGGQL